MAQISRAAFGGPVAQREIAHAPEGGTPRPAEVGPGRQSFRRRAGEGARRSAAMHVAVAVTRHPSQRLATRSTHEQMWAWSFRRGADFALLPDVADRLELLGKSPATASRVDVRHLVILAARAYRQPKRQPAARERIDRSRLLGQQRSIPQRRDHDHGGQPHPRRYRGGRRQRGKRLVVLVGDPIEHAQAAEWAGVGAARPFDQKITADAGHRRRKTEPDVQLRLAPLEEMISSCR